MDMMERHDLYNNTVNVDNETESTFVRTTADGRRLRYELSVIQQPERARACGQGSKSSSDRRPVDPPPILALKIKEGENFEHDVTFSMNATYVVFASLEQARHIAKARNQPDKSAPPVLTGSPVSGMVYLENPDKAGYFLFSDLSIRHEGKYRLSFSLFEEVKDAQDGDKVENHNTTATSENNASGSLTYRMDVRTKPFTVYSAKKFPGLAESTGLSKTMAEQGCRVRIRRDVRMRRREQKPHGNGNWDSYEDATAEARARMSATPDPRMHYMDPVARPRSSSNASLHSVHAESLSRRPSLQEMNAAYSHPAYNAPSPAAPSSYAPSVPYSPHLYQQQPLAPPAPSNVAMPPPHYQSTAPPTAAPSQQYYPYPPAPSAQQPYHDHRMSYGPPAHPEQHMTPQMSAPPPTPQQPSSYSHQGPLMSMSAPSYQPSYSSSRTPSISSHSGHPAVQNTTRSHYQLPPLSTSGPLVPDKHEPPSPSYAPMMPESNKRTFSRVFNDKHQSAPLRNGDRPRVPASLPAIAMSGDAALLVEDEEDSAESEIDPRSVGMSYRRADGRRINRSLPAF